MQLLEVKWVDAASTGDGWTTQAYLKREGALSYITTVGYLFEEKADRLTLVQSHSTTTGDVMHDISIPKKWILKRRNLK